MDIKHLLGKKIKEVRKSRKMTQEILAEKIGIDYKSISNIECGLFYPSAENLAKIAAALEVQPAELFKFGHLKAAQDLEKEIFNKIKQHPEKLQDIYKIVCALTDY